jgi:hypothetical protein
MKYRLIALGFGQHCGNVKTDGIFSCGRSVGEYLARMRKQDKEVKDFSALPMAVLQLMAQEEGRKYCAKED